MYLSIISKTKIEIQNVLFFSYHTKAHSTILKKAPQISKKTKVFPFHEYGEARHVIVLTSNQSLTMLDGKWEDSKGVFNWEKFFIKVEIL